MKQSKKLEANDKRQTIFERDGYRCHNCGKSIYANGTPQLAHRICKSNANINKYGENIIHHPLNLLSACCLKCNDAANIGNNPVAREALIDTIWEAIDAHTPGPSAE